MQRRRPGRQALGAGIAIEILDVVVGKAHADFHTLMLPQVGTREQSILHGYGEARDGER